MKYFLIVITTQYDGYEWGDKWLTKATTQAKAIVKAENFNFTHFDDFLDEYAQEEQRINEVREIPKAHFDLLIENNYLYEL